jgi:hypothetical protein
MDADDETKGLAMSKETIERRAADIRRHWSRNERRQRALESNHRCLDLLIRLCDANERRGPQWNAKSA